MKNGDNSKKRFQIKNKYLKTKVITFDSTEKILSKRIIDTRDSSEFTIGNDGIFISGTVIYWLYSSKLKTSFVRSHEEVKKYFLEVVKPQDSI